MNLALLAAVLSGPRITLSPVDATSETTDPQDAIASFQLTNGGDVRATQGDISLVDVGDWIEPKVGTSQFEAILTNTSGTAPSGAALGTPLNLGTTRTWTLTRSTIGSLSSTNTLQIRRASTGAVLATATILFQATVVI